MEASENRKRRETILVRRANRKGEQFRSRSAKALQTFLLALQLSSYACCPAIRSVFSSHKSGWVLLTFLVPGNESLGNGLADGIDLGSVTTTLDANPDVNLTVPVGPEEEDRLPNLAERGGRRTR